VYEYNSLISFVKATGPRVSNTNQNISVNFSQLHEFFAKLVSPCILFLVERMEDKLPGVVRWCFLRTTTTTVTETTTTQRARNPTIAIVINICQTASFVGSIQTLK